MRLQLLDILLYDVKYRHGVVAGIVEPICVITLCTNIFLPNLLLIDLLLKSIHSFLHAWLVLCHFQQFLRVQMIFISLYYCIFFRIQQHVFPYKRSIIHESEWKIIYDITYQNREGIHAKFTESFCSLQKTPNHITSGNIKNFIWGNTIHT